MYHLNESLPAPYELNQAQPQPQAFARGGSAKSSKKSKMILAHFNPTELHVLDHLQGHQEKCGKTGLRSYSHLEELLKNPHIVNSVHHHVRQHHAEGGSTYGAHELEHLAHEGRNGDTEMALIGPHTHHVFNSLAGHPTINPYSGHPEYFSLKGVLGGLWNGIKGVGSKIGGIAKSAFQSPAVQGLAQAGIGALGGALGSKIGGNAGSYISNTLTPMASKMLPQVANKVLSGVQESPTTQAIGQGLGRGLEAYQNGVSPRQALGQGIAHTGQQFGSGGLGSAMQGFGRGLSQNQSLGQSLKEGAHAGFQGMGGVQGLQKAGQNILSRYQQGASPRNALGQGVQSYAQRMLPSHEGMGNLRAFEELPFAQNG